MKWFVFYCDDYEDAGLESFNTEKEALSYIEARYQNSVFHNLAKYILIHGTQKDIEVYQSVTKVRIKKA